MTMTDMRSITMCFFVKEALAIGCSPELVNTNAEDNTHLSYDMKIN